MPKFLVHRRPDKNQVEIRDALRAVGIHVIELDGVSGGCPDLAVRNKQGTVVFIEIKNIADKKAVLKKSQVLWLSSYPGFCGIATNFDEAWCLATQPETACLDASQKLKLAQYHATMTTKEVWLNTILKALNGDDK